MTDTNVRFVILEGDTNVIRDKVEGVNFRVEGHSAARLLCEQLESMHHTIGVLLEELDKLKFPLKNLNADYEMKEPEKSNTNG